MTDLSKSEKEIYDLRKQKVAEIKSSSIDSYATFVENSTPISSIIEAHDSLEEGEQTEIAALIRGRLTNIRSFGKLTFMDVKDYSGKIQLLISKDSLSDELNNYVSNLDVGDIVSAKGTVMKTKKGELSLKLETISLLSKSLRAFPEKWHGLKDKETRFRQRYLDLLVNEDAMNAISMRFEVIKLLREFMTKSEFVEVETPTLQPKAGGAIARPFTTHHNAMDIDMFLRIAPELYLKRLIIGGFEKVFEIGKVFRNEGVDQTHSPEFTMMESYEAFTNIDGVINMIENMCEFVFENLNKDYEIQYGDQKANFSFPWKRESMFDLVNEKFGMNIQHNSDLNLVLQELNEKHQITLEVESIGSLIYQLFEDYVEKNILNPTFVIDYPKEVSPFARESSTKKGVTERCELFAFCSELANGFSELIDSEDQRERLQAQAAKKAEGDEEAHVQDDDYIEALEYGLPPTGGMGFGIDRFVMMLTNNESIREVIAFPHLKPEN